MKDKFYADKRDPVKWGGIVHLCHEKRIETVLQVAYYRKDEWGKTINFNGKSIALSDAVIKHFRDIKDIRRLGRSAKLHIVVFGVEFSKANREAYHRGVLKRIKSMNQRKVVFLDPDTGLAPKKCEAEHVKCSEVKEVWDSLKTGDILVFYQHKPRGSKEGWEEKHGLKLAGACGVDKSEVRKWSAKEIAGDVVFCFVEKRKR